MIWGDVGNRRPKKGEEKKSKRERGEKELVTPATGSSSATTASGDGAAANGMAASLEGRARTTELFVGITKELSKEARKQGKTTPTRKWLCRLAPFCFFAQSLRPPRSRSHARSSPRREKKKKGSNHLFDKSLVCDSPPPAATRGDMRRAHTHGHGFELLDCCSLSTTLYLSTYIYLYNVLPITGLTPISPLLLT